MQTFYRDTLALYRNTLYEILAKETKLDDVDTKPCMMRILPRGLQRS